MKNYLKGWGLMRSIRLLLGILIVVQGIQTKDWSFAILGGLLSLMPIINIGCCGAYGCRTAAKSDNNRTETITYEEVR